MRRVGEFVRQYPRICGIGGAALLFVGLLAADKVANPPVEEGAQGVIVPGFAQVGSVALAAQKELNLLSDKALIFYRETEAGKGKPNQSAEMTVTGNTYTYTMMVDGVQPSLLMRMRTGQYGETSAAYEVDVTSSPTGTYGVDIKAAVVGNQGDATMYSYDISYEGGGVTMKRHFATSTGPDLQIDDVSIYTGYPWKDSSLNDTSCATPASVSTFMQQASDMLASARAGDPVPAPGPIPGQAHR